MNKDQIIKISAEAAVEATLRTLNNDRIKQVKERADKRFNNTKLLLKHYTMFKEHCANSIGRLHQLTSDDWDSAINILETLETQSPDIYIESIRRSVARTYVIVQHIDIMIKIYQVLCEKSDRPEDMRRYRIIKGLYIDSEKKNMDEIAEVENIDKRTCYRDINDACRKLSTLIFGVDGLYTMSQSRHIQGK